LFYSGINIGALLGAVCVYLGTSPDYGWSYALSAAIVMVIGLILFYETFLGP
jgi:POT family proton-dependent oligopeptide transporter